MEWTLNYTDYILALTNEHELNNVFNQILDIVRQTEWFIMVLVLNLTERPRVNQNNNPLIKGWTDWQIWISQKLRNIYIFFTIIGWPRTQS